MLFFDLFRGFQLLEQGVGNKKKDRVYLWTEYQKTMYKNTLRGTQASARKRLLDNENNNSNQ